MFQLISGFGTNTSASFEERHILMNLASISAKQNHCDVFLGSCS